MAKPAKKPAKSSDKKTAPKSAAKTAVKKTAPVKTKALVKTAASKAPLKKAAAQKALPKEGLAKTVVNAVGKLFSKDKVEAKTAKTAKGTPAAGDVKTAIKKPVAGGKKKKEKKGKDGFDMEEDDLLASDEEIGSEEIPDLSEFDESEAEETAEAAVADDEGDEVPAEAKPNNNDDEIVLTDAEGRRYCRVRDCDQISAVEGYCRYHYLLLWKKIQVRRKILVDGKLERYVEELTARYPDKFLEMIRKDLRTEKDFLNAIAELEIDESAGENEFEDEAQSYVDEIRGISTDTGMTEEEEF